MVERDELGDHSAHRRTGDMSALDAERVEQARRIARHLVQRVGNVGLATLANGIGDFAHVGNDPIPLLRQTDVPVVEANEAQARAREARAKLIRPGRHLAAETVDHQKRDAARRPRFVIFQLNAVGANFGHAVP